MPMNLNRLKYNGSLSPVRTIKASKSITIPSGYFSSTVSGAAITATSTLTVTGKKFVAPYGSGANAPVQGSFFVSGSGVYFSSGGAFFVAWGA